MDVKLFKFLIDGKEVGSLIVTDDPGCTVRFEGNIEAIEAIRKTFEGANNKDDLAFIEWDIPLPKEKK